MKKKLAILVFTIILVIGNIGFAESIPLDEDYSGYTFQQMKEEYFKAVENNNEVKQKILLDLGNKYLDNEIRKMDSNQNYSKKISNYNLNKTYNDHFYSVSWLWRLQKDLLGDGVDRNGYSLSIDPKSIIYGEWDTSASWDALVDRHAYQSQWNYKNMDSMKRQYVCHVNIAANLKMPWNLEVDRPYNTVSPFTCN